MIDLSQYRYWIFDMDGTLTVPIHDFQAIRDALGIPRESDILGYINSLPEDEAQKKHEQLEQIELELAHKTKAQPGIASLLEYLTSEGCTLGIITRNNAINTEITLRASGLDRFFAPNAIFTRESSAPKPAPDAIHLLMSLWNATASEVIMLGDYRHDLDAGNAAGVLTIYFDSRNVADWNHLADQSVNNWNELLESLKTN